jgi:hypothetical protein
MAENYYYSSLSGDEIESRLVGGVVFNADQTLTTSEKARARQNIGAGESDSTFKILGYYASYEDLIQGLQLPPQPGDAYGIGTASPYDIYVYDGVHDEWVDNGPVTMSDAVIDDEDIATNRTWSSTKINTQINAVSTAATAGINSVRSDLTTAVNAVSADLATHPRPNLLENWYFVGGGSQQGYGYFPLNSNGQTVYSGSGETINQWFNNYGTGTVQLLSNGLRLSEYQWFSQYLEPVNDLVGKTLTGTVLLADGSLFTGTIVYTGTGTQQITQITSGSGPTYLQMNVEGRGGCIRIVNYASGTPITVVAVKLEIGSTQTLAHQENGAWVLNEVPSYGEEYAETIASRSLIKAVTYSIPASVFGSFAQGELKQVSYTFPTAVPGTVINACMYGAGGWQIVIQIDALSTTGVVCHCANVGAAFTFDTGRELTVFYY